jgi:nuclear protein localization family protein 4
MIIRIRTNMGQWRVEVPATANPSDILSAIATTRPHVVYERPLSLDPACNTPLDTNATLESQGVHHGGMIYCKVDGSTCAENTKGDNTNGSASLEATDSAAGGGTTTTTKRIIAPDGSIKLIHSSEPSSNNTQKGFRKGQLALRDMKMAWTLAEFTAMDDAYNFKIKRQEGSFVGSGGVRLESGAVDDFQSYLRRFSFMQQRFGWLYGRFEDEEEKEDTGMEEEENTSGWGARVYKEQEKKVRKNKQVVVEAIYEPPQRPDATAAEGFEMLDDPEEENVEALSEMLGLRKVGWIVGHPPREKGFQLSNAEVIMAAELQLESAGGVEPTPFVTVRVTVDDDGQVVVEAFQVSLQCMEMVAEEALEVGPNPGFCYVNETFTAIQEGKPSATVENNFFLTVVPIHRYQSEMFVSMFPRANRAYDDRGGQTHEEMKRQLSKSGQSGWTFIDLLSDFALLLYLCKFLDVNSDMVKICESVKNRDIPLDDGYKIIISSMAGMDGSY